jgi:hypothetical protein
MAEFMSVKRARKPKIYKERIFPLDGMSDEELYRRYRFDREGLQFIFETFSADVTKNHSQGGAIPPEIQILVTIQYLASNTFQLHVGDAFGISQRSISNAIENVIKAITKRRTEFISFPTPEERRQTMLRFSKIAGFPNIIALVDGTQIPIEVNNFCYINLILLIAISILIIEKK